MKPANAWVLNDSAMLGLLNYESNASDAERKALYTILEHAGCSDEYETKKNILREVKGK